MSMAVQTSYGFGFPKGVPGGLYDLSAHEVSTRQAEGAGISFGIGVVAGTNPGTDVAVPTAESAASDFEGVVIHNSVMVEMDWPENSVVIDDGRTVGCLHHGKAWVKTGENASPAYKAKVYMITDGEEAGLFTTSDDGSTKVELNAHFLGITDDGIAVAEFFPTVAAGTDSSATSEDSAEESETEETE